MKSKVYEGMLLVLFLLTTALAACTDDEPKDRIKEIRMNVLPETGIMYPLFDDKQEYPIECLLVKTDDNPNQIEHLGMNRIEGFTYERGHEYYLSVKRTILANPPADGSNRTYKLIRILQDRLVAEPRGRHQVQRLVPLHEVFHQHQVSRQRRRHHLLRRRTQAALLQVGTHLARQHP